MSRHLLVAYALFSLFVGAAPRAAAQESTESASSGPSAGAIESAPEDGVAEPSPAVRALLVEAVAEYDAGRYAEAQALFRRANELAPSGRTLRGLGMASFELRQYVAAVHALEASLAATERPLTESQRAHVEELLARARAFVSRVEVQLEPADATLRIDGQIPTAEPDASVLVDPGRHVVVIAREGYESETLDLVLAPGTPHQLAIGLVRHAESVAPGSSAPEEGLAWAGAGVGIAAVAAVAVAATLGGLSVSERARLAAACDGFVCPESAVAARDRVLSLAVATDVVGTGAAALGATSLALVLAAVLGPSAASAPSASCDADGCVALVRGAF
ncbi:MAG: hypothetical protein U0234_11635 [Sandaracinus sp.]